MMRSSVKSLVVYFDNVFQLKLIFSDIKVSFYLLGIISMIETYLPSKVLVRLISTFVTSLCDYCNSLHCLWVWTSRLKYGCMLLLRYSPSTGSGYLLPVNCVVVFPKCNLFLFLYIFKLLFFYFISTVSWREMCFVTETDIDIDASWKQLLQTEDDCESCCC